MYYSNIAYMKNAASSNLPLFVNSCGNEHSYTTDTLRHLPNGRTDYQILYTPVGKIRAFLNGSEYIYPAGTVIIHHPNQPQKYSYFKSDCSESMWTHFSGKDAEDTLKRFGLASQNVFFINPPHSLKPLFLQLISECQSKNPFNMESASLILQNILLHIARNAACKRTPDTSHESNSTIGEQSEITKAIRYFNEHFAEKININDYAKELHITSCWFSRIFRTFAGTTPMQYIIYLRISKAKFLLENTDMSISEISSTVGYADPMYFSRLFKKNSGITPLDYRKKYR